MAIIKAPLTPGTSAMGFSQRLPAPTRRVTYWDVEVDVSCGAGQRVRALTIHDAKSVVVDAVINLPNIRLLQRASISCGKRAYDLDVYVTTYGKPYDFKWVNRKAKRERMRRDVGHAMILRKENGIDPYDLLGMQWNMAREAAKLEAFRLGWN